ncbi:MAG: patatin-like phospholipase family protein [Thermodesulfobacteriota bacterium]
MPDQKPKRALILAGGGVKVAFQAGALQVWLDEAELEFDLADGASGGIFNLAMYCQGMTGKQIADNWRNLDPNLGISFNTQALTRLLFAESMFTLDNYRKNVFTGWGLDWDKIRASDKEATFNVYNFTRHELRVLTPDEMTEDFLAAGVSLPMWFPPVVIDGDTYIDPVFITDANLEEAIARGADELWIIWTVSRKGEWRDGFVANYFQIIETAAYGHFKRLLQRIESNNTAIASGKPGEFGRSITVKLLEAEVPMHYLINFSRDRVAECVNLGVQKAREWCEAEGIPLKSPGPEYPTDIHTALTRLAFTEEMKGFITVGESDYQEGFKTGKSRGTSLAVRLTIQVDGVNRFVTHPDHEARIEGHVSCPVLGGWRPVDEGTFNLLVDEGDPAHKRFWYLLFFTDGNGNPLTLIGHKEVTDDPGLDLWADTTTLFVHLYKGRMRPDVDQGEAEIKGAGIIRIQLPDFMKQLTTFRVEGPTSADRIGALSRFGQLFMGKLWDVYAKDVLTYGPI